MKELRRIPLSKLLNVEVPILIDDVLEVLERHDIEALHLQGVHEVLVMQKREAKTLAAPIVKHPLTPELERLHKKRLMYASLINAQAKAMLNVEDKKLKYMAVLVRRVTKKNLAYLGQMSRGNVFNQLHQFNLELKSLGEYPLRDAFKALGLEPHLNELQKAHAEYSEVYEIRRIDMEKHSRKDIPTVKRDTLWVLRLFYDKVISNQKVYKDVDYSQLIHDLNIDLTANSKRIRTRIATNKRRARKRAEAEKEADEQKEEFDDKDDNM